MSRSRKMRTGFSLIEMVMVIGAVSLLLGLCAGLLHVMLKVDRIGRSHLVEATTVGRLARQFRRDVHAGKLAAWIGNGETLELNRPDGRTVYYAVGRDSLSRIVVHGRKPVEQRESYRLSFSEPPHFVVRTEGDRAWVTLRLPRANEASPASLRHDIQIEALEGRDLRWAQPRETSP
jgi:hypothetical protein